MSWPTRLLRLLFLFGVILGLGWMHTIGSHGHHDPGSSGSHGVHAAVAHVVDTGADALSEPTGESGVSVAMCLAILAAAVVLAALLAVRVRRADAVGPRDPASAGHGPPRLVPPGLIIADSTVLRI